MEMKDTLSSCSDSKEQELQKMKKNAKKFSTFNSMLFHNMDNLEKLLNKELLHEKDSKSALSVIKVNCDKFLHSKVLKPSNYDGRQIREIFKEYTRMEAQSYKDLIIQYIESIENCIVERELNEQEIQKKIEKVE
ncbi:hypothetical protein Tco_1267354 [Tanacetum coccineum]